MSIRIVLSTFFVFIKIVDSTPFVHTNVGWIEGVEAEDGDYFQYLGIPYGLVNESNVFGKAIPYPPFNDVFQAHKDLVYCPQVSLGIIYGTSPNCLQLNIYVPKIASPTNKVPVMVWIHGGSFVRGNACLQNYNPKFLLRHNVIVVSVHYRVGIYGFMCLDIPEVPGNQGLKDTLLAMRWIKHNIYWFGGDPDRITMFGVSAGGRTIDFHILSHTEQLFNNAILQSGTTLDSGWLIDKIPDAPIQILKYLGYTINDIYEAVEILSALDPTVVLEAINELNFEFKPCVEKNFDNVESFVPEYPVNILKVPKANNLNVIIGTNSHEMLRRFYSNFATKDPFRERLAEYFDFDNGTLAVAEKIVREFYISDAAISESVKWEVIDFDSDIMYVVSSRREIKKLVENNATVYHYLFGYHGERNYAKNTSFIFEGGAAHADELGYLFDVPSFPEKPSKNDQLIIDIITAMWTNFAKTGNPTPEFTKLLTEKWPPITKGSPEYYMEIDSPISVGRRPFNQRMMFWELFFEAYGEYQKGYKDM